ncbi:hypothetical protein [Clostridium sp.]|uniref:hypothetical protein n=1 Tax=Clostridium sp. TaxID=1506 RepID=UPI003D6CC6F2
MDDVVTKYYSDGSRYVGEFKNQKPYGVGTFYFNSGDKYIGKFKYNGPNGMGTAYNSDGSVYYEGEWKNGKPK